MKKQDLNLAVSLETLVLLNKLKMIRIEATEAEQNKLLKFEKQLLELSIDFMNEKSV
jgi:hypothetical protein